MRIDVTPAQDDQITLTALFPREELVITSTPPGLVLSLPGCRIVDEPGAPGIPRASVRVALPIGMAVAR